MPYLGNEPGAITDAFTQTFTGNGSTTNFTLQQASTTNAVFVRVSGVMQRNGTDFTVDGTTLAFTTAPPDLANNIVVQFFTLGSVQEIAADAVTVDKLNLVSTASVPSLEAKGDGSSQDGYIQLNCSQNSHGIKLKSPPHSAGQSYTLTYPSAIVDGGFMKTDSSGNLSFATPGLTLSSETATTSGTAHTIGSLPSGIKQINLMLEGVSFNGTGAALDFTIGDAGGLETSGYLGTDAKLDGSETLASATAAWETHIHTDSAAYLVDGHFQLSLKDASNYTWVASWNFSSGGGNNRVTVGAGVKSLSAELTQISVSGGTFDNGSIAVSYF